MSPPNTGAIRARLPASGTRSRRASTHVWREAAMPPNVLASEADIKEVVDWILSLKK